MSVKPSLEPGVFINKPEGARKFQEVEFVQNNNGMLIPSLQTVSISEMAMSLPVWSQLVTPNYSYILTLNRCQHLLIYEQRNLSFHLTS